MDSCFLFLPMARGLYIERNDDKDNERDREALITISYKKPTINPVVEDIIYRN